MEEEKNKKPSLEDRIAKLDPNFNMLRFLDFLGFRESLCEYDNFNKHGKEKGKYIGKYMFGEEALRLIGYGKEIDKFKNFTKFKEHFFCNPELQEEAMKKWIGHLIDKFEDNGLTKYIGKPLIQNGRTVCPEIDLSVLLTLGHISGTEGARQYIEEGINRHDGTKKFEGTYRSEYAVFGYMISHYPEMEEREMRDYCVKLDDRFRNTNRDYLFPINEIKPKPIKMLPVEDKRDLMEIKHTLKDFVLEDSSERSAGFFHKLKDKIDNLFEKSTRSH